MEYKPLYITGMCSSPSLPHRKITACAQLHSNKIGDGTEDGGTAEPAAH